MVFNNQGDKYTDNAIIKNLSGSGLYMWANRYIEPDSQLTVTIHLYQPVEIGEDTCHLITKGIVVRTEPQSDGTFGIAVVFYHYRFN
jgi:hypothetical protein